MLFVVFKQRNFKVLRTSTVTHLESALFRMCVTQVTVWLPPHCRCYDVSLTLSLVCESQPRVKPRW